MDKKALAHARDTKNKLSLVQTPISSKQILKIFQRTPTEHIYQRPGKGGGNWEYVTGVYVKKVLNYVFGFLWDFQIIDKGREGDVVWVQGRLTIRKKDGMPMIIKEQFGRSQIKYLKGTKECLDYGNDLKGAATDALKKCAAELGIASDVYGKEEFKEIAISYADEPQAQAKISMEQTLRMIATCKDADALITLDGRIKESKNYTKEQKSQLHKAISSRVDELTNQ